MTRPAIAEPCAFPGDISLSDDVNVIRWDGPCHFACRGPHGHLFIDGYRCALRTPLTLEGLAADVLGVVLDPVPAHLVTPFAEAVISRSGPSWTTTSDAVMRWIEAYTGRKGGGRRAAMSNPAIELIENVIAERDALRAKLEARDGGVVTSAQIECEINYRFPRDHHVREYEHKQALEETAAEILALFAAHRDAEVAAPVVVASKAGQESLAVRVERIIVGVRNGATPPGAAASQIISIAQEHLREQVCALTEENARLETLVLGLRNSYEALGRASDALRARAESAESAESAERARDEALMEISRRLAREYNARGTAREERLIARGISIAEQVVRDAIAALIPAEAPSEGGGR